MACPFAARVAAGLADPAGRLAPDLAAHLPVCPACRAAAARAIRAWPTDYSPSLPEWLSDPSGEPTLSEFQARAIAAGRLAELEMGPYLLLDRLGAGGMGEVFRARHNLLRRIDAVKTVRPEFAANAAAVKRFLREAESAARLRHPNVVQVYTADRAGSGYYIAMEFVPGSDLGKLTRSLGRLPVADACEYVRQAAEGLHHAFLQGLVHRDVKPGNLLLSNAECGVRNAEWKTERRGLDSAFRTPHSAFLVKVTDFGVARAFSADTELSEYTATGAILGTTDYMAPEQAEDAHAADTRADVYSLGCTLFHLLTGQPPFPGGSLRDKLNRHATAGTPPLSGFRPDVPRAVELIVGKCMAKRPGDRFQTPAELAEALAGVLVPTAIPADGSGELPTTAAFDFKPEPLPLPAEGPAATYSEASDDTRQYEPPLLKGPRASGSRPRASGVPWFWLAAGVLVIAGAVGLVLQLAGGPKRDDTAAATPPDAPNGAQPRPKGKETPKGHPAPGAAPPSAGAGGNWVPVGEFKSQRKDKVRAVGFGPKGEVIAGREGEKADGTDSCWWEVWPAAGGTPTASARPPGVIPFEMPVAVSPDGRFIVSERLNMWNPSDGFAPVKTALNRDIGQFETGATAHTVEAVAISHADLFAAVNDPFQGKDRRWVVEWSLATGEAKAGWNIITREDITAVACDRLGQHMAAWAEDGTVRVRDGNEFARDWKTVPSKGNFTGVALTPDGKTVFAGHAGDGCIYGWDVKEDKRVIDLPCPWAPWLMTVSPDGRWLVTGGYGVRVFDLSARPPTHVDLWPAWAGEFRGAAFSPDGKRLAIGGGVKTDDKGGCVGGVWVWELQAAPPAAAAGPWKPAGEFKSQRKDKVRAVGFGAKGELIAGRIGTKDDGSDCGWWEVWPAAGGAPTASVRPDDTIPFEAPMGVAPGGRFVVSDRLRRWNPADGFKPLPPLAADLDGYVTGARAELLADVAFSGDGECLVACLNVEMREKRYPLVAEWKTDTGAIKTGWQITETREELYSVATNRHGDHVAVWGKEGKVWLRDTNVFKRDWATTAVKDRVTGLAMTSDQKTVFAGHAKDEAIYAWDVKENKRGMKLECPWQPHLLVLSPDDRWLVVGGAGARVFDLAASPPGHFDLWGEWSGDFRAAAFSPDGKRLAVGGSLRTGESTSVGGVWVWELKP